MEVSTHFQKGEVWIWNKQDGEDFILVVLCVLCSLEDDFLRVVCDCLWVNDIFPLSWAESLGKNFHIS